MAKILRRNLISVTEGPVTLLDACYHSRYSDRVILYFSKNTEIDQVHVNPPWRVIERISVDGAWTLHLEHGGNAPVSLVLLGAHHEVEPARPELDIFANKDTFLAVRNKEGAVIFDRALPDDTDTFAKRLKNKLSDETQA